jgi:hypothetical protein
MHIPKHIVAYRLPRKTAAKLLMRQANDTLYAVDFFEVSLFYSRIV